MHGFNRHPSLYKVNVSCNLQEVESLSEGDSINLDDFGFDKLLGKGRITKALNITVAEASARAIEKVEAAGGSVILSDDEDDELDEE